MITHFYTQNLKIYVGSPIKELGQKSAFLSQLLFEEKTNQYVYYLCLYFSS